MIARLQAQPEDLQQAMANLQLGHSFSLSDVQLALKEIAES
jgi:tryptophanyl-tRNA synthetase